MDINKLQITDKVLQITDTVLTSRSYVCENVLNMAKNQKNIFDDTCWVYVQIDDAGNYIIGITYEEQFCQRETEAERPLLFWRKFDDTLSAAGYRMVLKGLSPKALLELLKKYNTTE